MHFEEKAKRICFQKHDEQNRDVRIQFSQMNIDAVQRLSTPSYVELECREKIDATRWQWYWEGDSCKDDDQNWEVYSSLADDESHRNDSCTEDDAKWEDDSYRENGNYRTDDGHIENDGYDDDDCTAWIPYKVPYFFINITKP